MNTLSFGDLLVEHAFPKVALITILRISFDKKNTGRLILGIHSSTTALHDTGKCVFLKVVPSHARIRSTLLDQRSPKPLEVGVLQWQIDKDRHCNSTT